MYTFGDGFNVFSLNCVSYTLLSSEVIGNVVTHDRDLLFEGQTFEWNMFGKFICDFLVNWHRPVYNKSTYITVSIK